MKYAIKYDLTVDEIGYIKMRLEIAGEKPTAKKIQSVIDGYSNLISANFSDDVDYIIEEYELDN